jgi:hypothetical protein
MADVNPLHKLIVAGVFAALAATLVAIAAFEKPSCPTQGTSQMSKSVSICKAINGE